MVDNNRAPHNTDKDTFVDWLVKSLKSVRSGRIVIDIGNENAIDVNADESTKRINIDILNPDLFKLFTSTALDEKEEGDQIEDKDNRGTMDKIKDKLNAAKGFAHMLADGETGLFDKLDTAKEFAEKLTDNDMTIALFRKGKEAIVLGKGAKPSVSKIISKSDDLQIKSVSETSKLANDLKPEEET